MSWYNEAIFYHIYPLGLTGAPAQNDYGAPAHRLNTFCCHGSIISRRLDVQHCISVRYSKALDMDTKLQIIRNWIPVWEPMKILRTL